MTELVIFYGPEGRELCVITAADIFDGEIDATIEQLAHDNGIPAGSISIGYVTRNRPR